MLYNVTGEWHGRALTLTLCVDAESEDDAKAKFGASQFVGAEMFSRVESVYASISFNQKRTVAPEAREGED